MLYDDAMTNEERELLIAIAHSKLGELNMGLQSIEQALNSPQVPDEEKAFLSMQKAQLGAAFEDLQQKLQIVEGHGIIKTG